MEEKKPKTVKAVSLQTILIVMVAVAFLISLILTWFIYQTVKGYREMREATANYIDSQSIAASLLAGSDALTTYARSFVVTGDPQQVELYCNDNEARNAIDEAMAEVRAYSEDERVLAQLKNAMQLRDRLSVTEEYAMRLKIQSIDGDISQYPKALWRVQLLPADLGMSPAEQDEKARTLLFDIDYEASRNEISLRINRSMDVLMSGMLTRQVESSDHMSRVLYVQHTFTGALICALLVLVVIIFTMVILPLRRQINSMSNAERLDEAGASEVRFLARTYNQLYDQNRLAAEKLEFEATHDELTGLYNRKAYATALDKLNETGKRLALILLDVDKFKNVNDQYGHDMGDALLKSVADSLRGMFRSEDMVCRIGGDEFAVIMSQADSTFKEIICGKLRRVSEKLAAPEKDLPAVSLSAGVVFSEQLMPDAGLFKSADLALYQVKDNGRNGYGFVGEAGRIEMVKYAAED